MRVRMLLIPLVATAAFLAGCTATPEPSPSPTTNGVEALEAEEILERAQEALDGAKSYRIVGEGEVDGEVVELDLLVAGESIEGTMVFEGIELELIVVEGDGAYVKAGDEFWATFLPADAKDLVLPLISGKYVKLPAGTESELVPAADDLLEPDGEVTKGDIVDVKGTKAIAVLDAEGGELHVAIEGEPYPLQIVAEQGTIEFLDIDEDATIEAPDASDVLDLEALIPA